MKNLSYTNEALIDAFKNGDKEVYKYIYLTYYQDLCVYIKGYTNDKQAAEDIVQNVLLKLWENRDEIQIHSSFKGFLYKSVYYSFMDLYRKKKRINEKLESLRYNILNELIEDDNELKEKRLLALRKAIEELPTKCKEIFVLSKFEGLKYKEIADALGISINTVENQVGKAFKILRKKMFENKYLNLFINFFAGGKRV
ncbi:RNA polymerase sigma factor [Flavivirga eckloniae]|uniref:RNA polymerase sigma factor n=1 Tax=Flavivirga eckloniae TaxID=1803846 RepID=UPI0013158135|nr:RNA polymerase sigma-70 factor [Flavivirga eckloniae]